MARQEWKEKKHLRETPKAQHQTRLTDRTCEARERERRVRENGMELGSPTRRPLGP